MQGTLKKIADQFFNTRNNMQGTLKKIADQFFNTRNNMQGNVFNWKPLKLNELYIKRQ